MTKCKLSRVLRFIRESIIPFDRRYKKIEELISTAESKSYKVCEDCGMPGNLRNDIGWIRTLCIPHYMEVLLDKKNY